MIRHLMAMHEPYAIEYLERRANITPEDRKAAYDIQEARDLVKNPPSIYSIKGSHATVIISGPLSKKGPDLIDHYFGFGGASYEAISAACADLKSNDEVKTIDFEMDSGGGYVDGVDEAFQSIAALSKVKKTRVINVGMVASACYWLACGANEIVGASPTVETGSIGVKVVGYDWSAYLENVGIKRVVILSENAPNKDYSLETEVGRNSIQSNVDAIERIFYARVSEGRGVDIKTIKSDFGKGAIMVAFDPDPSADDAVSVGMIDDLIGGQVAEFNPSTANKKGQEKTKGSNDSEVQRSEVEKSSKRDKNKCGLTSASIQETHTVSKKLKELLAENSGAQSEYDAAVAEAKTGGFTEGKAEVNAEVEARVKAAETVFGAEAAYPKAINELAIKVMFGTEPKSSLTASVATIDAMRQEAASLAGGEETTEIGGTGGEQAAPGKIDGVAKTEDDFQAQLQQGKKQLNGTGA